MKTLRQPSRGGWLFRACLILIAPLFPVFGASAGCTSMACLEWSEDKGQCPSKEDALKRFGGQSCVSDIKLVTSEPEFDGTACCYEVEKRGSNEGCGTEPIPPTLPCGGCGSFRKGAASTLCDASVGLFNSLVTCLCDGACGAACADGSCASSSDNAECEACAADTASGCGNELNACLNDG